MGSLLPRAALGFVLAGGLAAKPPSARAAVAPQIVYLNFSDGTETITYAGVDDSAQNRSSVGAAAPYPAFSWPTVATGVETRAELISRVARQVHDIFRPYNVLITLSRPAEGPYTTVMIGGGPRDIGLDQNFGGVAYMDCDNVQPANIVFAFPANLRGNEHGLVVTIAQEAGHAFGLEHTESRRDVMHPLLSPEQSTFLDEESAVVVDRFCNNPTQNSHRRLIELVGLWRGDEKPFDDGRRTDRTAPKLAVTEPLPGATVAQPFFVRLLAEDEGGIDHLVLTADIPGAPLGERAVLRSPPFGFSLAGLPGGPFTFTVTAYDKSGNTSTVASAVTVLPGSELPAGLGCDVGQLGGGRPASTLVVTGFGVGLALAVRRRRTVGACTDRRRPL